MNLIPVTKKIPSFDVAPKKPAMSMERGNELNRRCPACDDENVSSRRQHLHLSSTRERSRFRGEPRNRWYAAWFDPTSMRGAITAGVLAAGLLWSGAAVTRHLDLDVDVAEGRASVSITVVSPAELPETGR